MNTNIDVKELKIHATKLSKEIEEYEKIHLNIYNTLAEISSFWNDKESLRFQEKAKIAKQEISNKIMEMKTLEEVYKYIIEKYEEIGNDIKINLSADNEIQNYFNNYLEKISNIIVAYNNLNLVFCPQEAMIIRNERNRMIEYKKQMESIKEQIKQYYNKIENIEKEIINKISRIEISLIIDNDF